MNPSPPWTPKRARCSTSNYRNCGCKGERRFSSSRIRSAKRFGWRIGSSCCTHIPVASAEPSTSSSLTPAPSTAAKSTNWCTWFARKSKTRSIVSTQKKQAAIFGSLKRLLIWVIILAIWEAAFRVIGWKDYLFPAPSTIVRSLGGLLIPTAAQGGRPLLAAIAVSLLRLVMGFLLSIVLGAVLGLAMWRFRALDNFFGPLFLGLQTLPSVCWVPLAVLLVG